MAKGGILEGLGNLTLWASAYIAVGTLTYPFWMTIQNWIAGSATGNGDSGGMI